MNTKFFVRQNDQVRSKIQGIAADRQFRQKKSGRATKIFLSTGDPDLSPVLLYAPTVIFEHLVVTDNQLIKAHLSLTTVYYLTIVKNSNLPISVWRVVTP